MINCNIEVLNCDRQVANALSNHKKSKSNQTMFLFHSEWDNHCQELLETIKWHSEDEYFNESPTNTDLFLVSSFDVNKVSGIVPTKSPTLFVFNKKTKESKFVAVKDYLPNIYKFLGL